MSASASARQASAIALISATTLLERRAAEVAGGHAQHRAAPEPPQPRHRAETIDVAGELGSQRPAVAGRHVGER